MLHGNAALTLGLICHAFVKLLSWMQV